MKTGADTSATSSCDITVEFCAGCGAHGSDTYNPDHVDAWLTWAFYCCFGSKCGEMPPEMIWIGLADTGCSDSAEFQSVQFDDSDGNPIKLTDFTEEGSTGSTFWLRNGRNAGVGNCVKRQINHRTHEFTCIETAD